jgi:broad specificity phosphatase PhoE
MDKDIKIFLLRHAPTQDNEKRINGSQTDTLLSKNGKEIAKEIAPTLSKNEYDLIIVSPLKRTFQTIEPYLNSLKKKIPVEVNNLTIERDLGKLTNSVAGDGQIQAHREKSGQNKIEWIPPEGESILDVYERAKRFFNEIQKKYSGKKILICGHQVFLRCLEIIILNKSIYDFYSENPPRLENGEIRFYQIWNLSQND